MTNKMYETLRKHVTGAIERGEASPIIEMLALDVNGHKTVIPGDILTCAETGKQFVAARDGCTTNYAWDKDGNTISDEGVDIREKRTLLDRSQPFTAYLSSDSNDAPPRKLTGWKGNVLGTVISATKYRLTRCSYTHGSHMYAVTLRDVHGGLWYGRGNPGFCITIRPKKGK